MSALAAPLPGGSEDGEVVALGSAAGKNDFTRFAAKNARGLFARLVEKRARLPSDVMDAGWIAEHFAKEREHGFANHRVQRSGGVIVEIDRAHATTDSSEEGTQQLPADRR